jgi:MFS family permease
MGRRSPIRNGLGMVFRSPSVWLAEVAWRWSFAVGASLLIFLCLLQFLDVVAMPQGIELWQGRNSRHLAFRAVAEVFQGNGTAVLRLAALLAPALIILWVFAAALGRSATLKFLLSESEVRVRSILGLNFLRVFAALAALFGCLVAVILAGHASSAAHVSRGTAVSPRIFASCFALSAVSVFGWAMVNWVLTVAGIFAHGRRSTLAAVAEAAMEIRRHTGQFLAASLGFGLLRGVTFLAATFLAVWAVALATLSVWAAAVALLLVLLLYLVVLDFLHVARLAAYVVIAEESDHPGVG